MKIKNTIHGLFSRKREIEKKIEELQNACRHNKQVVKFVTLNEKDRQANVGCVRNVKKHLKSLQKKK